MWLSFSETSTLLRDNIRYAGVVFENRAQTSKSSLQGEDYRAKCPIAPFSDILDGVAAYAQAFKRSVGLRD